ncbi:MBL fold metallo-hydrolase [Nocardioides terrisoli]|uniref:MBL fold metallo-hydrolase n=1 Tax=Nocardioides terrisoli TaxID=3388267 RepID=UPI00287B7466|nr:MBL fold metallo-hydrolase [Nocardioides marmorisolisilvae]
MTNTEDQPYQSTGSGAWTEPGAYEVAPGVHRIPLPLPMDALRAVNVYVMETSSGLVLVDGGWAVPESRTLFEESLKELGYTIRDIRRFLVTHLHRDHYTQAYVVGQEVGAGVSLGIGDKPSMDLMHDKDLHRDPNLDRLQLAGALELAQGWRSMMPADRPPMDDYGMPGEWLDRDLVIDLGERQLDAVATPGHTQGHYVFADHEAGLLFAGDHVLPTITPSIGFEPKWVDQPLRDFLDSLAKVRAMPDLTLLPAHGPTGMSSHTRIDELVAHHDHRLELCRAAVADGARTAWEVTGELPWTRRNRRREELGPFDAVMAAFETLAHLELLALQGTLARTESDGTARFSLPAPA